MITYMGDEIEDFTYKRTPPNVKEYFVGRIGETEAKKLMDAMKSWSMSHGLRLDAVNENLPEVLEWMGGDSRKIFADEYIDDRISECIPDSELIW